MKLSYGKGALSFVLDEAPVARTVSNGEGILLDLDENDRVLAVEVLDVRRAKGMLQLAEEYDLDPFFQEIDRCVREASWKKKTSAPGRKLIALQQHIAHHHGAPA